MGPYICSIKAWGVMTQNQSTLLVCAIIQEGRDRILDCFFRCELSFFMASLYSSAVPKCVEVLVGVM